MKEKWHFQLAQLLSSAVEGTEGGVVFSFFYLFIYFIRVIFWIGQVGVQFLIGSEHGWR